MKITVIGTGYVGLVQAVGLASLGFHVTGFDIDDSKISLLRKGNIPIYEPGLEPMLKDAVRNGRLQFTNDPRTALAPADVIFIAVGTPAAHDRSVNLRYVRQAAATIGTILAKKTTPAKRRVVANKSTVPVGTARLVESMIRRFYRGPLLVMSNPEFLREGQAIHDFLHPDRIVIGGPRQGQTILKTLYKQLKAPVVSSNAQTAELTKYAANAYLASSISFINSLSWLAEKVDADILQIAEGLKLDKRIGKHAFLAPGPGYGGSCFPKDVTGLQDMAARHNVTLPMLDATIAINRRHHQRIIAKVKRQLGKLQGKTVAVWGLAFKASTDDVRESPALAVMTALLRQGARVQAYDPIAETNAMRLLPQVRYNHSALGALTKADLLLIMTEWPQFKNVSLKSVKRRLKKPVIVDARNLFDPDRMARLGFIYEGIGR